MKIGLTYTGSMAKHQNYVDWLRGYQSANTGGPAAKVANENVADGEGDPGSDPAEPIEVVKFSVEDDNFEEILHCDGLVLSGGVDIHPDLYGGNPDYVKAPKNGWERGRDEFERALLEHALGSGLPVFGVCRGLQLINVCLNGTLVQDLGEQGDETHENVQGDKLHPVRIETGSLLHAIAGEKQGTANSAHHQAIGKLGEGLVVNSHAQDGTIEGIEWAAPDADGKPFLIAVQWHPERMFTNRLADSYLYQSLRDRFIAEIAKAGKEKQTKRK